MGMYRCAACGSDKVVTDNQADGIKYNVAKGIAGTVVLGVGGAAAGIESNSVQVYKCPDCGIVLSYPMPNDIKRVIDAGCMDASVRDELTIMGMPVSWDFLISKYKNIDASRADAFAAKMDAMKRASVSAISEEIKSMVDDFRVELELCKNSLENIDELQSAWLDANEKEAHKIKSQNGQANAKARKDADEAKKKSNDDYYAIYNVVEEEKKSLEKQNEELSARRNRLGLFKGKEKQQIAETIAANEKRMNEILDIIGKAYLTKKETDSRIDSQLAKSLADIKKNSPKLPESPYENRDRLLQLEKLMNSKRYLADCKKRIHPFIAYFYIKINGVVEINGQSMQEMMMIQENMYNTTADADFTPGGIGYISHTVNALKKEFVDTKIMNNSGKTFSLNG